jgi:hypothetical protein
MLINNLCGPALIYLVFSLTQIIIDIFKELYNTAFLMCEKGLGVVSWMIVFVPFIFMTLITSILLFTFGLTPSRGRVGDYEVKYYEPERQPSSYNSDDGELLNNYYEEVDKNNDKKHHKKHHKKEHEYNNNYNNYDNDYHNDDNYDVYDVYDDENYREIRNNTDRRSEEYYEQHN